MLPLSPYTIKYTEDVSTLPRNHSMTFAPPSKIARRERAKVSITRRGSFDISQILC